MDFAKSKHKSLSVFSLVMMNVIAVDSLRNLAASAEYGAALLFFYFVAAIFFYIPTILVGAELVTGWPQTGGAYVWIREAFGRRWGFLGMWLQWGYNLVWFPTILAFVVGTLAYLFNEKLASNNHYLLFSVLTIYWIVTLINCFGIKVSAKISVAGALLGTLFPMLLIVILGFIWVFSGKKLEIPFSLKDIFPSLPNFQNVAFLVGLIFSLMGMEMSAIHAGEVDKPEKNYPKALWCSSILIWISLVLSSLAIAIVIPRDQLSLVSGLVSAFAVFLKAYHLDWLLPLIVLAIVIGSLGSVSTWIAGPTRGLMIAAKESGVLKRLHYTSRKGAPIGILLFQGVIFTGLCSAFILMPTVNSSYWMLTALTSQLALLYYILLFASAIRLRYAAPMVPRAFEIPGKKMGMWIVVLFGIFSCVLAILVGFLPPAELKISNLIVYEGFLVIGLILFCGLPFLFIRHTELCNQ